MAQHAQTAGVYTALTTPSWSDMAEVLQILCPKCHKTNLHRARFCQHCGHDIVLNNDAPSDERRYVITRVIKQGGQGSVYEGVDDSGRVYAIKEMLDRFTDPRERIEAVERFNAEAEMLQHLSHPRIPRVYSHFRDEGRHYLTMDFVRGEDLQEIVDREGPIAEKQVLEWAEQICDVLDHLHGNGLIYRDMKPSNVMIDRENGGVKLVDFGITKLFKPTERGTQIGTPGYAPPEQYQGLATPQSDVYALGATLHHLLTGRDPTEQMPFSFPPARDLVAGVSPRTSAALERALQKVPQDRFPTVTELWEALAPTQAAPKPAQVRVAPATTRMPQAAAQTAPPAAAFPTNPAIPPPLAVPARTSASAQPAGQPQAPPAPRRSVPNVKPQPRRGFPATVSAFVGMLLRTMLTLLLLAAVGLGLYVYFERPAWAEPYLGAAGEVIPAMPTAGPTDVPVPSGAVTLEVQVTVPSGSDAATIRQAFLDAFRQSAQAVYGPAAQVNTNVPPSYIGGQPVLISDNGVEAVYGAQMQGYLFEQR